MTDSAICKALKMSRRTLWEWRLDPRFRAWLLAGLNQASDDNWPLILRRHELLAMNGSVRSADFIAKVRFMSATLAAARNDTDVDADPTTNYTVNVLAQMTAGGGCINLLIPRPPPPDSEQK